jgi:dienelactone hydrolase
MSTSQTALDYYDGDTLCKGVVYAPQHSSGPLPVVLVTHAWDGLVQEVHDKAKKLAEAGFIAFGIDVYGGGLILTDMSQMMPTVEPFMGDRRVLLKRMQAAVNAAKTIPNADPDRIAAMGYCFGGLCVLDLARGAGNDVKAVVSFHGSLLPNGIASSDPITAKILVLHGNDDPLVPPEQVQAFIAEMDARKANWEFTAYSGTVHAFTRPDANDPKMGALYDARADRRSWQAMLDFFGDVL